VAIPFQVWQTTHSYVQVGAVSLAQLVPLILGALIGGALGEMTGRRQILVVSYLLLALAGLALAFNATLAHPSVLLIYLVSAAAAGFGGVVSTTSNAAVPALVQRQHIVAAYSFMQAVFQLGTVVGPAMSGVLIGLIHLGWVFTLVAVIDVLAALAMLRLAAAPPARGEQRPGIGSFLAGLQYIRKRQEMQGAYLIDINAMVFGMPRALFPALALTVFHGGPDTLGLLYTAPGAGALVGALTTGWLEHIRRQALAVIIAVCAWGAFIAAFGFTHVLWLALLLLAGAGWADVLSAVLRATMLQASIPESYRSRIASVQIAVVQGGPRLGDMEAGAVASATSAGFSIVSGGLACIVGAVVLAAALPRFRRHVRPPHPHEAPDGEPAVAS